ncbi:hypothetical protein P691DRAFT_765058 [Macrolepiota fuliginosa MF-IS2]|uniref:Uncharacterized protein n=1 Tax=Macrolepiota fuliginosa MF-IS2 TaxID=1400762 RepID=A0A9P5X2U4_9AGAR|nr:hypothetical protein P691DRAFT_765058 [Macrolepiota fuliginosa MF-IS2]
MFRLNIQRVTSRTSRLVSTTTKTTAFRPTRSLTSYTTTRTTPKPQTNLIQRYGTRISHIRHYAANNSDDASNEPVSESESSKPPEDPKDIPWIEFLESVSKAPWLTSTPPDFEDRLRRAYSLLFHIILYLGRPLSNNVQEAQEATQQFLLAFDSAPVPVGSEIGRARHGIALLTKTITNDISSIPLSSELRAQHAQIFALTDALVPLCDVHLQSVEQDIEPLTGDVVEAGGRWQDFWTKAQPIVLALGEELDKEGYGIGEELAREAKAEQERKDAEKASEERK